MLYSFWSMLMGKPFDLETISDFGNRQLSHLDSMPFDLFYSFSIPNGIITSFLNYEFKSPLIAASFQPDKKALSRWLRFGLGGVTFKTMMLDPQTGNERPRLSEIMVNGKKSFINAMGLPGEGVQSFVNTILDENIFPREIPLGLSIGGDNKEEYVQVFHDINRKMSSIYSQLFYELNISCPNTNDGKMLSEHPDDLLYVLSKIREESQCPIIIKLSPDQDEIEILRMIETIKSVSDIGINTGNTSYMSREKAGLNEYNFKPVGGGVSGPSLFLKVLNMIKLLKPFKLPIIATGGIDSGEKAKAAIHEGATLIGMASALVIDPYCIPRINQYLGIHK
ncbi:MAG: hypothetical protein HOF45_08130 [Candidatus Marinimicrobia bacterium]|nr:hypothetical protein [Candidatus Neomarinimicrobiota bacterium]MBT3937586.1 hypothetical protein [Candidatus Neomarinimicrobiota bacterium]MBT4635097.1 hypothetical protein [Candidatus Neomarinimicrobiota bacterium]MBT4734371.1 hypothetical protein [Candidatus Neomarinimicrobiota bacterium]MBT6113508.1 hypothetical protein [Candidatus Neomarinimicrobiota bacterium]